MRKVLTCSIAVAMLAVGSPAQAKVVSEVGIVPRAVHLEHRLDTALARIESLSKTRNHLHRYIEMLRRRVIRASQPTPTPTPAPPTSSAPPYTGGSVSDEEAASLLRNAGFPEDAIPTMIGYMHRESGGDPTAVNSDSGACGLWQINPCPGSSALDPQTNANLAYAKFDACGLGPWAIPPYC
jgi:hypothetical protein